MLVHDKVTIDFEYFFFDPTISPYGDEPEFDITYQEWKNIVDNINFHDDIMLNIGVFDGVNALLLSVVSVPFNLDLIKDLHINHIDLSNKSWITTISGFQNVTSINFVSCHNLVDISGIYNGIKHLNLMCCNNIKTITNFMYINNFYLNHSSIDLNNPEKMAKITVIPQHVEYSA
jgi:hypothetical protein